METGQLKIYLFCCSTGIDAIELQQTCDCFDNDELKVISLPCSGKADLKYIVKAFETGADGAAILTCKEGDCSHLQGNLRARNRALAVDQLLQEIGLEAGRITVIQMIEAGMDQMAKELGQFRETISKMPVAATK
jgi:F420-non-reducing hydrogenase iron-sulfur subunit